MISFSTLARLPFILICGLIFASCGTEQEATDKVEESVSSTNETIAQLDGMVATMEQVYSSDDFKIDRFGPAKWLSAKNGYTLVDPSETVEEGLDVVLYNQLTNERTVLISAEQLTPEGSEKPLEIDDYIWSDDNTKILIFTNTERVWRQNTRGDYWVLKLETGELKQTGLSMPESTQMFAKFSPDGTRIAYVSENNIYVENLATTKITALTSNGSKNLINGTFDWAYEEELNLQDGFRWSPDGNKIAYWQLDTSGVKNFILINNTDDNSNYPTLIEYSYPKVGEQMSASRVGIIHATGGETTWVALPGDPRLHYLGRMGWANNSDELILQQLNRSQNTNNVFLAKVDTGEAAIILVDQDDAWVDLVNDLKWLDEGQAFSWVSDKSGWRNVYRVSRDGKEMINLTPGGFDILNIVNIDDKENFLYFIASPDDSQRRYLFRTSLIDGSGLKRLTPKDQLGDHSYQMSQDSKFAIHTFSNRNTPTRISLVSLPDHKQVRLFADNSKVKDNYDKLKKGKTEFFSITNEEGVTMEGFARYPSNFDPSKKYPVLFYVYGEPAGQTARDNWGGTRDLWHTLIAEKGYIIMTMDNRGQPSPKGREWRKAIHKKLGDLNTHDQMMSTKALLKERTYLDPVRVGVWGWSGGGTSTLNLMFRYGDVYNMGVAVAPVPDLRLYDGIYQERYSGTLPENAAAYETNNSITYAEQLKGNLLLIHGTGDDNVHYQGTERLINKLVEFNKPFDLMSYPNRTHGIREGEGTSLHLFNHMTRYIENNLKPGAQDKAIS